MIQPGQIIADRYVLDKLLGKGGFSEVWLATDNLTNVKVAIKIFASAQGGLDEEGVALFSQEFAMVFDMNHTNLLHPTHYDCWERMPYLILPYCKNGSAFKYLSDNARPTEDEAWQMLHDVADGLAYLHAKNPPVIHQDIKPDNILISDEGHYMITDFGISARARSTMRKNASDDAAGTSGGTLAYMGPERYGKSPLPIMASDVWSLGAMMFEALAGWLPFGENGGAHQKNGAEIPTLEGDYSDDLKQLIYMCLAKEPWDRPTARQLAEAANRRSSKINPLVSTLNPDGIASSKGEGAEKGLNGSKAAAGAGVGEQIKGIFENVKDKKPLLYGVIAVAVIAIVALVAALTKTGDGAADEELIEAVVPAYADSLYQGRLDRIIAQKETADMVMCLRNNIDKKADSCYISVYNDFVDLKKNESEFSPKFNNSVTAYKNAVADSLVKLRNQLNELFETYEDEEYDIRAKEIGKLLNLPDENVE